ncbi:MAG: ABC transporter ATP-binding protein [Pirellulaceae bacterium]|nr:ABC transporter ATP-binding protein [Pirellulaceae bacterium]
MGNSSQPPLEPADAAGLEIHGLSIGFGQASPVIDGLELSVCAGEIVALVGASGCGKSTLLRAVAGLQPYQAGTIQATGSTPIRRLGDLAFVFQDATLLPWRTTYENVALPFELQRARYHRRLSAEKMQQRVAEALESVELGSESWHRFPRQLSGGMKMRASIARALVTDPSLLLLDEPFAALDDLLRSKLNQLLLELWQRRRRTILFVTHNIAEAAYLSHRIVVLGGQRVSRIISNSLGWPRSHQQRSSVEFAHMYGSISSALSEASS